MSLINGFSNITTGAEVGSFRSAVHEDPDPVSKLNGPDFSILKDTWGVGWEIAHLIFLALFFLLYIQQKNRAMAKPIDNAIGKIRAKYLIFDLGFRFGALW